MLAIRASCPNPVTVVTAGPLTPESSKRPRREHHLRPGNPEPEPKTQNLELGTRNPEPGT
eukprot:3169493-Pyramimonas_sp.AAC.1